MDGTVLCPSKPGRISVHVPANTCYYGKSCAEELKVLPKSLLFVWSRFHRLEIIVAFDMPEFLTYRCTV